MWYALEVSTSHRLRRSLNPYLLFEGLYKACKWTFMTVSVTLLPCSGVCMGFVDQRRNPSRPDQSG